MNFELVALSFILVLTRCAAFVGFAPWLGGAELPRTVKVGLAVGLSLVWFEPMVELKQLPLQGDTAVSVLALGWLVSKEFLLGASLGYLLRLIVLPARIAGSYVGQELGLNLAVIADPGAAGSGNIFAQLLEMLAGVLFFTMDIHHSVLAGVDAMFRLVPIGGAGMLLTAESLGHQLDLSGARGLLLVAPVGIAMFVTTVSLSLLTRSVPQLNLLSVGFPIRLVVGIALILLCMPQIVNMLARLLLNGSASWLEAIS